MPEWTSDNCCHLCCYCCAAAAAQLLLLGYCCRLHCFCRLRCCYHMCCYCHMCYYCCAAAAAQLLLPPMPPMLLLLLLLSPVLLLPPVLLLLLRCYYCSASAATRLLLPPELLLPLALLLPHVLALLPPPPPPAVLGCLALPLTFPALSDLITVANDGGRSGVGGSSGGGHQELEPSCVDACAPTSIVYAHPSTILLCLVVLSASSGSIEGGDPTAADTATSRRSPHLETPLGFPPRTSSPPLQPVAADFGGAGVVGGGDSGGAGSGGATSGGARSPLVGGVGGTCAGGAGAGGAGAGGAGSGAYCPAVTFPHLLFLLFLTPESDLARAARPTIPCCLAALVTARASSPAAACGLVAKLAGFATTCRRAYLAGLVSASLCPPSVGGELALGCDVLEDRHFDLEYLSYPLSIRTRYVAPGRHHPADWRAARRVLCYLVRLASIT
ncbi:unnamed protein product [Closterium sp. NIES-54]